MSTLHEIKAEENKAMAVAFGGSAALALTYVFCLASGDISKVVIALASLATLRAMIKNTRRIAEFFNLEKTLPSPKCVYRGDHLAPVADRVEHLLKEAGINRKIALIEFGKKDSDADCYEIAYANEFEDVIGIHSRNFFDLTVEQQDFVLAHEISHLRNDDVSFMLSYHVALYATLALSACFLAKFTSLPITALWLTGAAVAAIGHHALGRSLSRTIEHRANREAAELIGTAEGGISFHAPIKSAKPSTSFLARLFSTHPGRAEQLEKLAALQPALQPITP